MVRNEQAWELLSDDEQLALTLKYGYNKSTWEAGEIMEKAHYKFLEIEARGKKFLEIFTEHYDLHDQLIPMGLQLEPRFRSYIVNTIEKRMNIREAVEKVKDNGFLVKEFRDKVIISEMQRLMKLERVIAKNFALLVFEFDRWNNFRILPKEIQEPSAFKRRNKKNDQKNLKNILSIHSAIVEILIQKYKSNTDRCLYVPMISKFVDEDKSIIEVKRSEKAIAELSRLGYYIFTKKQRAKEFLDLLIEYKFDDKKHCKDGQRFWPKFRMSIRNAINYNNIQKKIASRKFLESALSDLDINILNPKTTAGKESKDRIKRLEELGITT